MTECKNCGEYYYGMPDKCPKCGARIDTTPEQARAVAHTYPFTNIGTKIKEYALRLYIITIIVCIILGIIYARDLRGDFQFVLFLQYVVGGIGVGFFEYLLLLGFGTLIEDVGFIRNQMEQ